VVTCPLAPSVPHLVSGSCSSPRAFGLGFLQTSPRDDALALLLAFGSAKTWRGDFHPTSSVSCPAHTGPLSCGLEGPSARAGCSRARISARANVFNPLDSAQRTRSRSAQRFGNAKAHREPGLSAIRWSLLLGLILLVQFQGLCIFFLRGCHRSLYAEVRRSVCSGFDFPTMNAERLL
jgi:hypothetical protein